MLLLMGASTGAAFAVTNHGVTDAKITQQSGVCKGVVKDATGETIIGASVVVKGTTNGTITGIDGDFSLSNVKEGDIIVISFVGYQTQEVKWNGQSLNVTLLDDTQTLDEVVVTAMGIKKDAKKLGYAVSSVGSDELVRTGASNFASAMYGKASGVRIQAAPGSGTSSVSISVRGLSSITGTTQPLIIMDGVPIHNGDANNKDYWSSQRVESNGLVDINPEDIENISILKGAAASALYGSEAANGVVMITTKSGKGSKGVNVDFSANVSMEKIAYMPKIQKEYGPGYDNALVASNGTDYEKQNGGFYQRQDMNGNMVHSVRNTYYTWGPKYDGQDVYYFDNTYRPYSPIDHNQWNDIFRTGWNQTYNLAVSSAGEKNNVRFSYTYNDIQSTQLNSNNNKHNFALNGSTNVTKTIKLDYSASYMRQHIQNRAYRINQLVCNYGGMFGGFTDLAYLRDHTVTSMGYMNVTNGSETLTPDEAFAFGCLGSYNLIDRYLWNVLKKDQIENNNRFIGSVTPSWNITDWLTLRGRISTDVTSNEIENQDHTEKPNSFSSNGTYTGAYGLRNNKYEIYYGDIMLMFDKTFAEKHNITANIGWSGRQESYYESNVSTDGGLSQENWFHLNASTLKAKSEMSKQNMQKTAMFATVSYGYDSWGYLEGTARQEKISTLAKGNNSFFYPSINGSVIYTELLKDKKPSWYDYGKVRVSYGIVGNAPAIYYATQGYEQGNFSGYVYNTIDTALGNNDIKPEKKYEFEVGWENKFFGNRLGFELSYYYNDVKDQILKTTTAASQGGKTMLMNVGELTNSGLEISAYGTIIQNRDWRWDLRGNVAFNKNKIKKLADGLDRLEHLTVDNGAAVLESHVGESMGDWYVYGTVKDEHGNKIVDSNGLYKVDYTTRQKAGNAMPKLTGGISSSLSYKSFTLDATVDFRIGGSVLNLPYQYMREIGNLEATLANRDPKHGGLTYYCDGNDLTDPSKRHLTDQPVGSTVNGCTVYGNGVIQPGVKEDGSRNDIIVTAGETNYNQYGWGYSGNITYENAIQKNTYFKLREVSLSYTLPKSLTKKFACNNLSISIYGRNLFYFYKSLKEFDSEASDGTSWIYQAQVGGSTATTRTFGASLRASF